MEKAFPKQSYRTTTAACSANLRCIRGWNCLALCRLQRASVITEAVAFLETSERKPTLVASTSAARPRRSCPASKHFPTEATLGDHPSAVELTHATKVLGHCAWSGRCRRRRWRWRRRRRFIRHLQWCGRDEAPPSSRNRVFRHDADRVPPPHPTSACVPARVGAEGLGWRDARDILPRACRTVCFGEKNGLAGPRSCVALRPIHQPFTRRRVLPDPPTVFSSGIDVRDSANCARAGTGANQSARVSSYPEPNS